jgi:hypothetical protein
MEIRTLECESFEICEGTEGYCVPESSGICATSSAMRNMLEIEVSSTRRMR